MLAILLWLFSLIIGGLILYWIINSAINYSVIASLNEELRHMASDQKQQQREMMAQMREMQLLMREQNDLIKGMSSKEQD